LGHLGYRVLVVAERYASQRRDLDDERVDQLELLGLLGLADPVRPAAAEAVRQLRQAGVEVVMLTGDHPSTAASIAAELDLVDGRGTMTGAELASLQVEALAEAASNTAVFARVSPSHKVAIVRALQKAGRIVAVTGDGANDAPAIRLANVGIALGQHSTAAARHAADIVIADDRIETIVDAVIESRAMWRSVRDSVGLLVGGNLGEIGFAIVTSLLSAQPPLRARQILLVNLLTDLAPALVVAVRPPRGVTPDSLLHEGPDAAVGDELTRAIVTRAVATASATTAAWLAARATGTQERASTVALASLVCTQLAQTAATSGADPVVLAAVAGSATVLAGLIQAPVTSAFFGSRPIGPVGWTIVLTAAAVAAAGAKQFEHRRGGSDTSTGDAKSE
jgi:cation-transporting ATPase I